MRKLKYYFFIHFLLLTSFEISSAQRSFFDIIDEEEKESYVIQADFSSLHDNRYEEVEVDGTFKYLNGEDAYGELPIKIELRGKFRRAKCDFPPIKITLKKKAAKQLNLQEDFRTLKMVTHCYTDEDGSYAHLFKENLVYQLYGLLSPDAYRTKLIRVRYEDTSSKEVQEFSALIIEDTDQLAYRIGAYETKDLFNLPESEFNRENLVFVNAFQFMIANADWNKDMAKNVKIFKRGEEYFLVPYDFDFSGFVDSKFARANNTLGLYRIKDRAWQGPELNSNQQFSDFFKSKRTAMEELIQSDIHLSKKQKREQVEFIDTFFKIVEQKKIQKQEVYPFAEYMVN